MEPRSLDEFDAAGRRVLLRLDLNSPIDPRSGRLLDDKRLRGHVGCLNALSRSAVVVLAHQSRPGKADFTTLESHAERLGRLAGRRVEYVDDIFGSTAVEAVEATEPGDVLLLENSRFYSEEFMTMEPEDAAETHLVRRLAPLFDAYVNDAFSAAHRSQPSLVGFPERLPSYAGSLMERELEVLGSVDEGPEPRVFALGGAKPRDAFDVVRNAFDDATERVLTSGVPGNLLLMAKGYDLGEGTEEFMEAEGYAGLVDDAEDLLASYDAVETPSDVAVAVDGERVEVPVDDLPVESPVRDVGLETMVSYAGALEEAGTAVVNGPAGVYEEALFQRGTREILVGASRAELAVAGGGDTAAAIDALDVHGFDHVSSGGGASTAVLSGDSLPAVEALARSHDA